MQLFHGDCLIEMNKIIDKSIDLILCDLPYGTIYLNNKFGDIHKETQWDIPIPFSNLWEHYWRILKNNGAVLLFGSQPFTTAIINSQAQYFRYCLVWDKTRGTNFQHANLMPMKSHEDIAVFYLKKPKYFPQMREGTPYKTSEGKRKNKINFLATGASVHRSATINEGTRFPLSILPFKNESKKIHPTQKPTLLLEYLIKTYTEKGDIVLDNCMGSGSTGIACINTNRKFIGIEKDNKFFNIAKNRINDHLQNNLLTYHFSDS